MTRRLSLIITMKGNNMTILNDYILERAKELDYPYEPIQTEKKLVVNPYEIPKTTEWYFDFSPRTEKERVTAQMNSSFFYGPVFERYVNERFSNGQCKPFEKVHLETVSACNGHCSFCGASKSQFRHAEVMSDEVFEITISGLVHLNYSGKISIHGTNEPLLDKKIAQRCAYIRKNLPKCRLQILTNGTLLTKDLYLAIIDNVATFDIHVCDDSLVIPNNIAELIPLIQSDTSFLEKTTIYLRKENEYLAQKGYGNCGRTVFLKLNSPCIMPFYSLSIAATGDVTYCDSDFELRGIIGNVRDSSLYSIWNSEVMNEYRSLMLKGRSSVPLCKHCDFF